MKHKQDKKWKLISRKKVYDGSPYINIFIDSIKLPNGSVINDYHRIEVNNAVMLLIENNKNELLVYNEYRHGIGELSYTFPAGGIEDNESIEETAKREVLEELGLTFNTWKLLKKNIVSGSYMFSELNFILIKDIKKICKPKNQDIENPDIMWLSKNEVRKSFQKNNFIGLTYATAALIWLYYEEKD